MPKNVECCDGLARKRHFHHKGGQAPLWWFCTKAPRTRLGIPYTPFTNTPHTAARPRKAPMDVTFSHIKAVFCDIDGTLLTSQHTVSPRTVAAIPRPARARRALWPVHRARRPRDRGHVRALGHRRPGGRARGLRWCRGHRPRARHQRAELSAAGETIARICKHMADLPATPVCPRDGVFYVPESNACVEHLSRVDGVPYQVVDFAEFLARAAAQGDVYHGARGNAAGD